MDKKLCVVIGSLAMGGAERHLVRVLPKLSGIGYEIVVFVSSDDLTLIKPLLDANIKVDFYKKKPVLKRLPGAFRKVVTALSLVLWLFKKIKKEPIQIIHFYLPVSYLCGMVATFLTREKMRS